MTIAGRIKHLEKEHAEIDKKIDGMELTGRYTDDHMSKLKKQRLHIKEDLAKLQQQLTRDESND